jgi:ketosteroid isomerase-like protein
MRTVRVALVACVVAFWLSAYAVRREGAQVTIKPETSAGQEKASGAELESMLTKLDAAQQEFHNGRPAAIKALWSHADDVTLAGGSGGAIEKGWARVGPRLDWAASQYTNGVQTNERITVAVSGSFAYVVQMEHIRFHVPGQERESKRDYRITMVFRREPEGWRIVHRQADTQVERQTAH